MVYGGIGKIDSLLLLLKYPTLPSYLLQRDGVDSELPQVQGKVMEGNGREFREDRSQCLWMEAELDVGKMGKSCSRYLGHLHSLKSFNHHTKIYRSHNKEL